MRKQLDVSNVPLITTRISNAIQLSAIEALPNYCEAWLCNEFINLRYLPEDKIRCDFLHKDFWFTGKKMFIRQSLLLSKETLQFESFDVIKFIISAIDEGKYITGDFDAYYISNKKEYNIIHKRDTYLIHGYDLYNESFCLMGDTIRGYAPHEVRFADYISSISNRDDNMFNINIMEHNPEFRFDFSKEKLFKNSKNYIESMDSNVLYDVTTHKYGLDAIRQLYNDMLLDYGCGQLIRDKSFMVLSEHKKLMVLRLKYINNYTNIPVSDLVNQADEIYMLSKDILRYRQMFINDNNLHNYPLITNMLQLLITKEESLFKSILIRL